MKLDSKQRYNNKTTLWAVVPAILLFVFSTFAFWMSPLGLGFDENAVEKLNSGFIYYSYQLIYWTGPASIFIIFMLLITGLIKPDFKMALKRIILLVIGAVLISQISMLIYLGS